MKLIDTAQGSELYYKLLNQIFIVAQASNGPSVATIFSNLKSDDVLNFIKTSKEKLSDEKLIIKLIGAPSLVNSISKIVEGLGLEFKRVVRNGEFEVFYFPKEGRLRVSKEEQTKASKVDPKKPIKVLVVDDSKTIRNILNKMITVAPGMEVVGQASKPSEVEELIQKEKPDVITLEIS